MIILVLLTTDQEIQWSQIHLEPIATLMNINGRKQMNTGLEMHFLALFSQIFHNSIIYLESVTVQTYIIYI